MYTIMINNHYCPVTDREIQVEELYNLEGTNTCQIATRLLSWRCLNKNCPDSAPCPLYSLYTGTGEKSLPDI
ncbi:hypothetical protein [Desulfoscipio geothermicus]|uniref:Uncharacterized protein n=1 Tax=Desulfoscipio geothermicus DSM 3669 TaxID=1121426 RepID=A0A1I6DY04_9FIRM|nr:hypothetical protein [Desulfoscipio geothermicus]SFR10410.1 hypothetical protein SAMN05660706_1217 [Desulfoscipio geothermicus DSM 3669]